MNYLDNLWPGGSLPPLFPHCFLLFSVQGGTQSFAYEGSPQLSFVLSLLFVL